MSRGSKAAAEAANETQGGVETVLSAAGHAFGDKAGGTSGILWGLLLEGVGKGLGNTEAVTTKRWLMPFRVRLSTCKGSAKPSSATRPCWMLCSRSSIRWSDRSMPELRSLKLGVPLRTSAEAPRKQPQRWFRRSGSARPLAERSVGTPDPGAISLGLIVTAIGEVLGDAEPAAPEATESMEKEGQPR